MRTRDEWLCDTPDEPGCLRVADPTEIKLCQVEGSEIALCKPCGIRWREKVQKDSRIIKHCPRCAPRFLASLALAASGASEVRARPPEPEQPTGSMYYAVERAMFAEGILIDVRQRVLARLAKDDKFSHFARVADIVVSLDKEAVRT